MPQETLITPQDPRPSRLRGLWDRLRGRSNPERLEIEPDKAGYEDPPVQSPKAMNLENLAINDSANEPLSNVYEDMSDVSSVSSDEIPQEEYKTISRLGKEFRVFPPGKPPMPKTYQGIYEYPIEPPAPNKDYVFLGNRDMAGESKWYPKTGNIADFENELGRTTLGFIKKGEWSKWMDLDSEGNPIAPKTFESLRENEGFPAETYFSNQELQKGLLQHDQPLFGNRQELFQRLIDAKENRIPGAVEIAANRGKQTDSQVEKAKGLQGLKEANQARLSRQNSPEQPYPENWNPQANTRANRAWGAQNIANSQAEIAQEQARVSGLGTAARGAQAAEALPGAAARAGNAVAGGYAGLSNFAARTLPIINLGLLGYGLYNQAKNNQENARYRKMVEGNRI